MTLEDISRMLKYVKVPRAKVVHATYPDPAIIIHVPASHLPLVAGVVDKLMTFGEDIRITLLDSQDVRAGEFVYVRAKGFRALEYVGIDTSAHPAEQRRQRRYLQVSANRQVVIDCASAFA